MMIRRILSARPGRAYNLFIAGVVLGGTSVAMARSYGVRQQTERDIAALPEPMRSICDGSQPTPSWSEQVFPGATYRCPGGTIVPMNLALWRGVDAGIKSKGK